MNIPDKTKEDQIDTIVDELVRVGQLLYFSNKAKMFEISDTYHAKIKAYREELKQLLKED